LDAGEAQRALKYEVAQVNAAVVLSEKKLTALREKRI